MAIGILSLTIGIVFTAISFAGIRNVEKPQRKEVQLTFDYPKEFI